MTNQHQATPDEWAQQEDWANRRVFSDSSCIIELRDRVEALETTQQPRAFTGQVVAPITSQAGPGVALYLDSSERQHGVTSDRLIARDTPAPAGSLVDRLQQSIDDHPFGEEARAAILEVAAWVRSELNRRNVAALLEQEANR
jgi:hypothetical protein